ncbi:hypothetical protein JCM10213v2_008221 [Rhodosporidiobolus nylandii]
MPSPQPPTSTSAPARSPSPSPTPSEPGATLNHMDSRIRLPPSLITEEAGLYEGEAPNVLVDGLLKPSSARPGMGERGRSWTEVLTGSIPRPARETSDEDEEETPLTEHQHAPRRRKARRDRSESLHRRRAELPWWKRPSPVWFIPGTLAISLSMGMTIAPKLEIYTQLICRSLPPEVSGVTAPPPILISDPAVHPLPKAGEGKSSRVEWIFDPEQAGEMDPEKEWSNQCHRSSAVQGQVARLALVLTLMMGVLSSLTTGFWGAFSDRRGRKPVLVLALLGTVLMDAVFLLTVKYHTVLSYNFLLVGPLLDGLLGGFSTAQATTYSYLSDVTPSGSRARIFSVLGGLMFGGIAAGPVLGSILISRTGSALTPFYVALALHGGYLVLASLILPESLEKERREAAQKRHEEEKLKEKEELAALAPQSRVQKLLALAARPFAFLKPIALLLPHYPSAPVPLSASVTSLAQDEDDEGRRAIDWGAHLEEYTHPEDFWKRKQEEETGASRGRDWTLTRIAAAWGAYMGIIAVMSTKILYANYSFGWTGVEDGYFLSYLGVCRVITLVVLLPLVIRRVLGRREAPLPIGVRPEGDGEEAKRWEKEKKWLKVVHDSHFDLRLAFFSLLIDFLAFVLFILSPLLGPRTPESHVSIFLVGALLQSLGSGATPAIQSLALAHASPRDAGRLFASLSVVQALASQVFGPLVFGVVFIRTVGGWSEAIFALAAGLSATSVLCLAGVKLRRVWVAPSEKDDGEDEESGAPMPSEDGQGTPSLARGRSGTRREVRASESGISLRTQAAEEQ